MTAERLIRVDCDRCPATITVAEGDRREGWGQLNAAPCGDGAALSAQDLCPDCYRSLFAWRHDGAAALAPAPAPAPRKPEVSKPTREAAYETADEAVVAVIAELVTAIQNEPTIILDPQLDPSTLLETKPFATSLVDQLIRDFGLLRRGR